jgi:hypothetical protein
VIPDKELAPPSSFTLEAVTVFEGPTGMLGSTTASFRPALHALQFPMCYALVH